MSDRSPAEGDVDNTAPRPGDAGPSIAVARPRGNASQRTTDHRGWVLWTKPRAGITVVLGVEAWVAAVTGWSLVMAPMAGRDLLRAALIAVLGVAAAEGARRVERTRRRFADGLHVNLTSVWTLAAALTVPPQLAVAVTLLLYGHLWWRSWRPLAGMHAYRVVFSAANASLCCIAAGAVGRCVPGDDVLDVSGPADLARLVAVIAAYSMLNTLLAAAAIATLRRDRTWQQLLGSWRENAIELATLCMGVLTAALLTWRPWMLPLIMLPIWVLHRSVLVQQLVHVASTDEKTGLLNAASWRALAETEIRRAADHGIPAAVIMLDLDAFSRVDKVHGRDVADATLRAVADALRHHVRDSDLCGRLSDSEFVVMLTDAAADRAVAVAERLRHRVREVAVEDPDTGAVVPGLTLSASIGVAMFPKHGENLDMVMLAADNAVFAAKDHGRNTVCVVATS